MTLMTRKGKLRGTGDSGYESRLQDAIIKDCSDKEVDGMPTTQVLSFLQISRRAFTITHFWFQCLYHISISPSS